MTLILVIALAITTTGLCQGTVTGTILSKEDNSPLPGVNVVIKGTQNGTVSIDGTFSLTVIDPNSILVFSFIGFVTQEYPLNGQTNISIKMKPDCIRDYFDAQRIAIYASSGLINTPIGGHLDLALPAYFGKGTLSGGVGYQTDLDENEFINAQVELNHFVWTCNFDMDANWYYRKVVFDNDFNSKAYSFETNLDFGRLTFIAGYSNLTINNLETMDKQNLSGPIVGIGSWIGGRLRLTAFAKVAIYNDNLEYLGQIRRDSRYFNLFLKFYKLNSFTELSLGIGKEIGYRFKKQKR